MTNNGILKRIPLYVFLASKCTDEHYPPFDDLYLDFSYGEKLTIKEIKSGWRKTISLIKRKQAPEQVGIYIHWPYCVSKCTYCFCDSLVPNDKNEFLYYLQLIKKELKMFSKIFKNIKIHYIFIGGGTPTFISDEYLEELFIYLYDNFSINKNNQINIECSPHTLTRSKLELMKRYGVNRLSFGVQSLDGKVLGGVNRLQTKSEFEKSFNLAREIGNFKINIDLMAGLENQSAESFLTDLKYVINKKPNMISVYGFDPRKHTLFSLSKKNISEGRKEEIKLMIDWAKKILMSFEYASVYDIDLDLDHDHTRDREDTYGAKYNSSILGIGHSAISHAFGSLMYKHSSIAKIRVKKLNYDVIPNSIGMPLNKSEEIRRYVIRHLMKGFSRKEFAVIFGKDISKFKFIYEKLKDLENYGKIKMESDNILSFFKSNKDYLIWSKHIYSNFMVKKILSVYKEDYKKFKSGKIDDYFKKEFRSSFHGIAFCRVKE